MGGRRRPEEPGPLAPPARAAGGGGAPHALCSLAKSRCWLQSSKSQAALQHLDVEDCSAVLKRPRPLRVSLKHALHLRNFADAEQVEL